MCCVVLFNLFVVGCVLALSVCCFADVVLRLLSGCGYFRFVVGCFVVVYLLVFFLY